MDNKKQIRRSHHLVRFIFQILWACQALDLLWCYQNTLKNILRCLPTDLVAFDDENAGRGQDRKVVVVRLLRPIVSSDWDRSRLYAHRVRELDCGGDSLCPALKSLCIRGEISPSASACLPLAQLPHLATLRIPVDDFATLEVIGKLQNLTYLTLRNLPRYFSSSLIDASLFENARQIDLLSVTPTAATEFLRTCAGASLTSVEAEFDSWPSTSALNQLYMSLGSCHDSHLSLTSLMTDIACFSPVFEGDIASHAVDSATFRILFCFQNLTEDLEMTFDAFAIPPPYTSGAHVLQTSLTCISPGYSPILVPFQVARFISGIFPGLDHILTSPDDDAETEEVRTLQDQWKEVESHIPTIRAIREEGRMWAQSASDVHSTTAKSEFSWMNALYLARRIVQAQWSDLCSMHLEDEAKRDHNLLYYLHARLSVRTNPDVFQAFHNRITNPPLSLTYLLLRNNDRLRLVYSLLHRQNYIPDLVQSLRNLVNVLQLTARKLRGNCGVKFVDVLVEDLGGNSMIPDLDKVKKCEAE
ncbi:hypothetical protein B0H14DRAFT_2571178 [Mycena olivaceomarginata]|nr:hypothetical protein B0H14DRAFT_2571178 [Mycena olivaceomarginata]